MDFKLIPLDETERSSTEFYLVDTQNYEKTPTTFDRSIEPNYGPTPVAKTPTVWESKLENGLKVFGIESDEVPLVQFNIVIDGGQLVESMDKLGVANLTADLLEKGTKNKRINLIFY